jgi:DNA-binding transcriptional LysR family regulator
VRIIAPQALGLRVARLLVLSMCINYPAVSVHQSLDDGVVDLVAEEYDPGTRLGQSIQQDMVTVRLSRELSWSVVAAPQYLARHGMPGVPQDILAAAFRYRSAHAGIRPGGHRAWSWYAARRRISEP